MGCFTPDPPKVPSYSDQMSQTLLTQEQAMAGTGDFAELGPLTDLEAKYAPGANALQLSNIRDLLMGVNGKPGLLSTYENDVNPVMQRLQSQNRSADIADVAKLGPEAMSAIRAYNPQVTSMLDTMNNQASERLKLNGALDPFTKTALSQDVRAGQAARGLGTGVGDAAEEAYYEDATRNQRRAQDEQYASATTTATSGYYGDPFLQILGRAGTGTASPGATVGQAQGMVPGNFFNPESQYAGGIYGANAAYQGMFPKMSIWDKINTVNNTTQGVMSTVGSIVGAFAAM